MLWASAAACWTTANCGIGLQHPSHGQETFPRMSLGQEKQGSAGIKLEKARQWGIHIVSVGWLHHVIQYGYGGKEGAKGGCESDRRWSCN